MNLAAYIRVSKTAGREGDTFHSPDQQRQAIEHAAALAGATVAQEFIDLDESGGTMDRPGVDAALELVRTSADGIIVAKLDRFARTAEGISVIDALEQHGKVFISAAERFDTSTPFGKFALGMMVLVAKLERDKHVENWQEIERRVIARGVHPVIPYGYQRSDAGPLQPSAQADVVRSIYRWHLAGDDLGVITRRLNEQAAPTPSAAEGLRTGKNGGAANWTKQTVRAILRNRAYLGEAFRGENVKTGAHPALIDTDPFHAAQRWEPARFRGDGGLLSGLVRCAGCGYLMGRSSSRGVGRYNCNRTHGAGVCPSPTTAGAAALEDLVTSMFLERYGSVSVVGAHDNRDILAAAERLKAAERELAAWRDDTEIRALIGSDSFREGLKARHQALQAAGDEHAAHVRASGVGSIDVAGWDDLDVAERRELLRAGVDDVLLSRAASTRTPLGSRVRVRWAGEADRDALPVQGTPALRLVGHP